METTQSSEHDLYNFFSKLRKVQKSNPNTRNHNASLQKANSMKKEFLQQLLSTTCIA